MGVAPSIPPLLTTMAGSVSRGRKGNTVRILRMMGLDKYDKNPSVGQVREMGICL